MRRLKDIVAILLAVNILEYHDKNWLEYSNKRLNEERRRLLDEAADILLGLGE